MRSLPAYTAEHQLKPGVLKRQGEGKGKIKSKILGSPMGDVRMSARDGVAKMNGGMGNGHANGAALDFSDIQEEMRRGELWYSHRNCDYGKGEYRSFVINTRCRICSFEYLFPDESLKRKNPRSEA